MEKLNAIDIAGQLRREILRGSLAGKDRLPPERTLAEKFGAARGTIRGAIRQLEEEGLVKIKAGSGTYVVANTGEFKNEAIINASPLELIDARFALEPHMCRLAVLNAGERDFSQLEELLTAMEGQVNSPTEFAELDTRFHSRIAAAAGNKLLIWMISQINSVRNHDQWATMRQLTLNEEIISNYNTQHRSIINAIFTRQPELAAQLMKEHLETARLSLTRAADT